MRRDVPVLGEIGRLLTGAPIEFATRFTDESGAGWHRIEGLADTGEAGSWIDEIVALRDGDRSPADAAAVVTVGRLAHAVVARPAIVFAVQGRALLAGGSLTAHREPSGPFDAVALQPKTVMVLPADRQAGAPGTEVTDSSAMAAALAEEWAAALAPIIEVARDHGRVGRRGLWGRVADTIGGSVLWAVQSLQWAEPRQLTAWRAAMDLCDALNARQPSMTGRPRLIRDRAEVVSVPSSCCLLYKADRSRLPDGTRERCDICPLVAEVAAAPSLPLAG